MSSVPEPLATLWVATRDAYAALENGDDADPVMHDLTQLFAKHGLDANTAESAIDWFDGGPGLLIESLRQALIERKPRARRQRAS